MNTLFIIIIGLLAQFFYTARILIQWLKSERTRHVESPTLFWLCSVIGSMLLFTYGWLRNDFSVIFGESLSFYIYLWNLKAKGFYHLVPHFVPYLLAMVPLVVIGLVVRDFRQFELSFLTNDDVPMWLLLWGSMGQFIYKMRFVYQWYYSVRRRESMLPATFWWMAVIGSAIIISYAIIRHDWILLLGQLGIVASIRNIIIGRRVRRL